MAGARATDAGVPRWLQIGGAVAAAAAALVAVFAGLYPHLVHHGDGGVHAYQRTVIATCERVRAASKTASANPVDVDQNGPIFDKATVISTTTTNLAAVQHVFSTLAAHKVPKALAADYRAVEERSDRLVAALRQSIANLQQLPADRVTSAQLTQVVGQSQSQNALTDLEDALTTLGGTSCSLSAPTG